MQGPGGRSAGGARVQGAGGRSPGRGWGAAAGRAATSAAGEFAAVLRRPQVASGWVGRGRRSAGSPGHKIEDRKELDSGLLVGRVKLEVSEQVNSVTILFF